jgi:hypothetical protein
VLGYKGIIIVGLDQGGLESHLSFLLFFAAGIWLFALRFRSCNRHTRRGILRKAQCALFGWRSLFSGCQSAYLFSSGWLFLPYCDFLFCFAFLDTNSLSVLLCSFRELTASCRFLGLEVEQYGICTVLISYLSFFLSGPQMLVTHMMSATISLMYMYFTVHVCTSMLLHVLLKHCRLCL